MRVEPGALVHGGGAAAVVPEEVVQGALGTLAGPGLSVQSGEVMQTCALELETKVQKCKSASRRFQPREGPSRGLLRDCEIFVNLR